MIFTLNRSEFSLEWIKITFIFFFIYSKNQAAFGFGFIRFALEYKKTPARATAVPAVKANRDERKRRKRDSRETSHECIIFGYKE